MAYATPDLKLVSNCGKFTVQVFNELFQVNKLTQEGAFLKLGRISPDEFSNIVLPLVQKAIQAINNRAKNPEPVKTITRKKKQDKQALVCPFKRADNDLTIGRDFGLYNVCANHCQIAKECKAICESLQTPIVEPVKIEPIKPVKIEPIKPVKPTKTESKLSDKARAHMVALLKTNNVSVSNGITDNALRLLYKNLKG